MVLVFVNSYLLGTSLTPVYQLRNVVGSRIIFVSSILVFHICRWISSSICVIAFFSSHVIGPTSIRRIDSYWHFFSLCIIGSSLPVMSLVLVFHSSHWFCPPRYVIEVIGSRTGSVSGTLSAFILLATYVFMTIELSCVPYVCTPVHTEQWNFPRWEHRSI
jgi:hypothetical protein